DSRRSPQDDRRQRVALDLLPQRLARPEDVLLAHKVVERARPHALGERAFLIHPLGRGPFRRRCVEETHAVTDLWRQASYKSIPQAMAAFSDSTGPVGIDSPAALARKSSLTPRASLPMTSAQARARSACAGV